MAAERARRIGRRIRELREDRELTQAQLAAGLDEPSVTSTYISRWERGEHEPLGDRLDRIAEVLGTTTADLMAGSLEEREESNGPAPDLFAPDPQAEQFKKIHEKLDEILREIRKADDDADDEGEGPLPAQPPGPLRPPSSPSEAEPESQEEGHQTPDV